MVSNREPYEHFHKVSGSNVSVPASGLVTALEPILRACDGLGSPKPPAMPTG
jgi:trehalose 6-phosphate synthase